MRLLGITAAVTLALDQASKWAVVQVMDLRNLQQIDVFSPFVNLRMAWNFGVNFGLFARSSPLTKWALIAVAVAISVAVLIWVRREMPRPIGMISAGLLLGGAMGNVLDRLIYGAVADFLNMSCCGIENPYSFNLADVSIFAGALGLAVFTGQARPPRKTP